MRRRALALFLTLFLCSLPLGSTLVRGQAVVVQSFPGTSDPIPFSIRVTGEVARPGLYELATATPQLVDVIRQAGGLSPNASGNIRIVSGGRADRQTFYSPLLDFRLSPGDLIVVDARPGRDNGIQTVSFREPPGPPEPAGDESAKSVPVLDPSAAKPDRSQTAGKSGKPAGDKKTKVLAKNPNLLIGSLLVLAACGLLWSTTRAGRNPRARRAASRPARLPDVSTDEEPPPTEERRRLKSDGHCRNPRKVRVDAAGSSASPAGNKQGRLLDRVLARVHAADRR